MTTQWSIKHKDQLDSRGIFIHVTLDPSCSFPSIFFDGRHGSVKWHGTFRQCDLSVRQVYITQRTTTCLACVHVYVGREAAPMSVPYLYKATVVERRNCDIIRYPKYPL